MSDQSNLIDIASGLDQARRVGWAACYAEKRAKQAALEARNKAEDETARLAVTIAYNECLQIIEPEGELILMARAAIARLKLTASGQRALRKILEERRDARERSQRAIG